MRVVRPGGLIIILCPEKTLWKKYVESGYKMDPPTGGLGNPAHQYEPVLGDFTQLARLLHLEVVTERMTDLHPDDFSILAVLKK